MTSIIPDEFKNDAPFRLGHLAWLQQAIAVVGPSRLTADPMVKRIFVRLFKLPPGTMEAPYTNRKVERVTPFSVSEKSDKFRRWHGLPISRRRM